MRTRIMVYGALFVIVALIALGLYGGYQYYYTTFADTPEKAVQEYFTAFSRGDYNRMYDMTWGRLGRPQTSGEFAAQMRYLVRDVPPRIAPPIEMEQIGSKVSTRFYRVTLKVVTPDASYRQVSMLVEVTQDGTAWKINYPFALFF